MDCFLLCCYCRLVPDLVVVVAVVVAVAVIELFGHHCHCQYRWPPSIVHHHVVNVHGVACVRKRLVSDKYFMISTWLICDHCSVSMAIVRQ